VPSACSAALAVSELRPWAVRLGIVTAVPVVACGIAASTLDVGFRVRYVAWGSSLLLVLLSAAIVHGRRQASTVLAAVVLVVVSALSLGNRAWNTRYSNEDTRGAAVYLTHSVPRRDQIFVTSGYMAAPIEYYLREARQVRRLPNVPRTVDPAAGLDVIRAKVAKAERFWLLYSRPWDGDPGGRLRDELRTLAGLRRVAAWPGVELYEGRGW
jgi:hypothetical protein